MNNNELVEKLYAMASKELKRFEDSLDTAEKAKAAAYELSVKRDILSYIENDLSNDITKPNIKTTVENLINSGAPLSVYYSEWQKNEYDNRMEAIRMTADDVYSFQKNAVVNELEKGSYGFSVVSFDGNKNIAVDEYVGKDDPTIYDFDEFINYASEQNKDVNKVEVEASFYVIGNGEAEADSPDEKQLAYINNHLDEILGKATLLESNTFTVDISDIERTAQEKSYIFTVAEFEDNSRYVLPGVVDDDNIKDTAAWKEVKDRCFNIDECEDLCENIRVIYSVYNAEKEGSIIPSEEELEEITNNLDSFIDISELTSKNDGSVFPWQEADEIIYDMKKHWEEAHKSNPSISDDFDKNNYLFPKAFKVIARWSEGKEYYNLDESIEQIKLSGKEWLDPFDTAVEMNRRGVDINDIEMLNVRYVSLDGSVGNKDITPEQYVVYHIRSEEHSETMKQAIDKYNTKAQNFLEAQNKVNTEVTQFFQNKVSDILFYSLSEKQIFTLTEANKKFSSDEEKIEIAKHIVPQNGAALYEIMCNNPIENELKTIGISPSEIVPKFKPLDNGMELMWNNVSVKINWQEYAKACFDAAEANATAIKDKIQNTVLYKKSDSEARETGELDLYQRSNKMNRQCSHMIDAVASSHYENNRFHAKDALDDIMERGYGIDRIALVVAVNIADKNWDARLSAKNISWAKDYLTDFPNEIMERRKGEYYVTTHPGLLNMFVDAVREEIAFRQETFIDKLNKVEAVADKIEGAFENGDIDLNKDEHSVGQEK